jgi:photosystem II stability/assembly factor-like uncharacterized protein
MFFGVRFGSGTAARKRGAPAGGGGQPAAALLAAVLLSLAAWGAAAAGVEYAETLPRASESLMLDITHAGRRLVAVGEYGNVVYSDDGGASWQQGRVPTTQMLTAVHFVSPSRGWAVGHDGLVLVSDDGAETWRIQRDGLAAQAQANLEAREHAVAEVKGLRAALETATEEDAAELRSRLDDAEMDLEDADVAIGEKVFTAPLLDIWFQNERRGVAVGAFGTLLTTDNGGENWTSNPGLIENPDEFHLNVVVGDRGRRLFIAGEGGVMYRSPDNGASWEMLESPYEGSWFGSLYVDSADILLVFGLRGHLYRSEDFGTDWRLVPGENDLSLAGGTVTPDGQIMLVGNVGTLLLSSDAGRSFLHLRLEDSASLSAAASNNGEYVLVGQGGVRVVERARLSVAGGAR